MRYALIANITSSERLRRELEQSIENVDDEQDSIKRRSVVSVPG